MNFTFHNYSRSCYEHYGTNGKVWQRVINLLNTNLPNKTKEVTKEGLKWRPWLTGHVRHLILVVPWTQQWERYMLPSSKKHNLRIVGASLAVQWLRIRLPVQGTWVWALVREDPTCHGATKTVRHNYWACVPRAREPQLLKPTHLDPMLSNKEKPPQWEARAPQQRVASAHYN